MKTEGLLSLLLVATMLLVGCSTLQKKTEKRESKMDPNVYLKMMIKGSSGNHNMAAAFLEWFKNDNIKPFVSIAEKHNLSVSQEGNFLILAKDHGSTFYVAMLKDISSAEELTDVLTQAHDRQQLPLLIVQYSNDPTDKRGENVFDIFSSNSTMAISHANRVYTKNL